MSLKGASGGKFAEEWSVVDVGNWLGVVNLDSYQTVFEENDVDGPTLLALDEQDAQLLVKQFHVRGLLEEVNKIKEYRKYLDRQGINKQGSSLSGFLKKSYQSPQNQMVVDFLWRVPHSRKSHEPYSSYGEGSLVDVELGATGKDVDDSSEEGVAKFPPMEDPEETYIGLDGLSGLNKYIVVTSRISMVLQFFLFWMYSIAPTSVITNYVLFCCFLYYSIFYISFGIYGHMVRWPILLDLAFELFGLGFGGFVLVFSVLCWNFMGPKTMAFIQFSALLGSLMFIIACILGLAYFFQLSVSPWYSHVGKNYAMMAMYWFLGGSLSLLGFASSLFFTGVSPTLQFWLVDIGLMMFVVGRLYLLLDAQRAYKSKVVS